jgi:hypothetical protein
MSRAERDEVVDRSPLRQGNILPKALPLIFVEVSKLEYTMRPAPVYCMDNLLQQVGNSFGQKTHGWNR